MSGDKRLRLEALKALRRSSGSEACALIGNKLRRRA
jgi:hypothetical protein